jgi:hypothetical protein
MGFYGEADGSAFMSSVLQLTAGPTEIDLMSR